MSKIPGALPARPAGSSLGVSRGLILVAVAAALLAAPFVFYPVMLMKVLCFALFATAVNLLLGYAGLLSFGHAMYFGGAAYVCAYARKELGWTPEASILAGVAFSAVFGLLTGLLSIRRSGIYFAMVTLALGQLFYFLCLQSPATGGEDGIQSVPRGLLFGALDLENNVTLYYFVLAVTGFGMLAAYRAINSPFGQILTAIRENEPRAISLGYRVAWFKALAFTLSAALAGLAGATKVLVFQLASLTDVSAPMSGEVVLMTLVGGMGTVLGPVVGAAIIVSMQNYLADVGEWLIVIQGLIFIATVSLFRRGVVGEIAARLRRGRGT
ncbi:branched-chain amino acid ABC transporter permease [Hansschlegelia zhihuaiae]|uniref:Branched-chain amino acid ABC transporter permease n=1 Tax=Hansschlegelia zhihuaiae TaxID=405005 RepID=A0A4V1KJU5_9HYPH|nr:branched-chain amino acid ABC transporter permease [Hansschlegelia zhihuaiae]RXF75412.1 branched-chain amino acid ABC transporter permease [Hansschlegelia zhihuaiae]